MLDVPSTSVGPTLEPPFNPYDTQAQLRQLENWSENDASLDVPVPVSPTDTVRTRAQIREIEDWMGQ